MQSRTHFRTDIVSAWRMWKISEGERNAAESTLPKRNLSSENRQFFIEKSLLFSYETERKYRCQPFSVKIGGGGPGPGLPGLTFLHCTEKFTWPPPPLVVISRGLKTLLSQWFPSPSVSTVDSLLRLKSALKSRPGPVAGPSRALPSYMYRKVRLAALL